MACHIKALSCRPALTILGLPTQEHNQSALWYPDCTRLEVLTAEVLNIEVFGDVTLCRHWASVPSVLEVIRSFKISGSTHPTNTASCFYSKTNQMHNFRVYWTLLYTFRTASPSIIRSSRMYTQHKVYVIQVSWLLASSQLTRMTYTLCCVYSLEFLMMDGEAVRNV